MTIIRRALWARRKDGVLPIDLEVVDRQAQKEQRETKQATVEASKLEGGVDRVKELMAAALTDTETPGVITAAEARAISIQLLDTSALAANHKQRLEDLSS